MGRRPQGRREKLVPTVPSGTLRPVRHVREAMLRPVVPARLSRASLPCHRDPRLRGESHDPGRQAPPFPVPARPPRGCRSPGEGFLPCSPGLAVLEEVMRTDLCPPNPFAEALSLKVTVFKNDPLRRELRVSEVTGWALNVTGARACKRRGCRGRWHRGTSTGGHGERVAVRRKDHPSRTPVWTLRKSGSVVLICGCPRGL